MVEAGDHVVERCTCALEKPGDIVEDLRGLGRGAAVDEVVVRVEAPLPAEEDKAAGDARDESGGPGVPVSGVTPIACSFDEERTYVTVKNAARNGRIPRPRPGTSPNSKSLQSSGAKRTTSAARCCSGAGTAAPNGWPGA